MTAPLPLNSLLGGFTLTVPVHSLLLLNGNVFGISGFMHRAARGASEALTAVAGLILTGAVVGRIEGTGPESSGLSISQLAVAGFLVGLGTKVSAADSVISISDFSALPRCPTVVPRGKLIRASEKIPRSSLPRHMVCGLARLSKR
jgi:hypothetical protein